MHRLVRYALVAASLLIADTPAFAQGSLAGEWASTFYEDQGDRGGGPRLGDYTGIPVNEAGRRYADSWDPSRVSVLEHQCQPYSVAHIYRGPLNFRVWEEKDPDTQELLAIKQFLGTYQQWRTIWMDGRAHPPEYAAHTWMGFSTGEWHGETLTVTTTHIKAEFFKRSGIPSSDRTTLIEHYIRHGDVLSHVLIATDPVYLAEPLIMSQEFTLIARGSASQRWVYNCEYVREVARPRHEVPHFLPGQNPNLRRFAEIYGLPLEGARGGAETTYPDFMARGAAGAAAPSGPAGAGTARPGGARIEAPSAGARPGVSTLHVQGNVHMIVGAGANIAVQVGEDGVLVVDTGTAAMSDQVLAAIRRLSDRPIRWIVNTHFHADHTGANEALSRAGRTVNGNLAAIVAHENAGLRMVEASVADAARPYNTYFEETRDFSFNGEPVVLYHDPSAHTDTDTVVLFRRSDVIVAGDVFSTVGFPMIDAANGGSVRGTIAALNRILDLAIPSKFLQEGGTFVVPGHGRLTDEADVVEYRDMLVIISERIEDMVGKGLTLEQVRAARPTEDYDPRYGAETGPWTTGMFIDAVYREAASAPGRTSR